MDRRCFSLSLFLSLSLSLSVSLCSFFLRDFPRRASANKAIAIGGRPDGGMVKYAGELCTAVVEVSTLREWAVFFRDRDVNFYCFAGDGLEMVKEILVSRKGREVNE